MRKSKDQAWDIYDEPGGQTSWGKVPVAVLMDIRDELKLLRDTMQVVSRRLGCNDCLMIPHILRRISRNTAKPRKARRVNV